MMKAYPQRKPNENVKLLLNDIERPKYYFPFLGSLLLLEPFHGTLFSLEFIAIYR